MDRQAYWNRIYDTTPSTELSWHQAEPTLSLRLIDAAGFTPSSWIIDVGGGDSRLVDRLLERDARCVTVLDVSASALARAKARLVGASSRPTWIEADVTSDWDVRPVDIWHDRAVFHFLLDPRDRARYVAHVRRVVKQNGAVILGTFALDGPQTCSGLRVQRYDAAALAAELGSGFALIDNLLEQHRTPTGAVQSFSYAAFRWLGP